MQEKKCPKCESKMLRGVFLTPGGILGTRWQEEEKVSKWFNNLGALPKVIAYKCSQCGFVENYIEDSK